MTVEFRRRSLRTTASPEQVTGAGPPGFADAQWPLLPPPIDRPVLMGPAHSVALPRLASAETPHRRRMTARGLARLCLRRIYLLLRPAVRPVAWRIRGFLLGGMLPQLDQLRLGHADIARNLRALAEPRRGVGDHPEVAMVAAGIHPSTGLRLRRKVHQFHAGSATGDAITNAMLLIRQHLRADGYDSEIYVEHLAAELEGTLLPLDELPARDDHVLIVHHSMGHERFAEIASSSAPKILIYHNITPPELLDEPSMRQAARLGRAQLRQWRDRVVVTLADSVLNGMELRRLGYPCVMEATLLFDMAALLAQASQRQPRDVDAPFTVLFVGRMVASKGQADLVDAFALFAGVYAQEHGRRPRLVLAGAHGGPADPYLVEIQRRILRHRLADQVVVTGKLSDAALRAWYDVADLYVSLSRHEGFGVPLIEAMARGLPVVALAAAAVPYTVSDAAMLLDDADPARTAAAMLDLARTPSRPGEASARRGRALERWRLDRHLPTLHLALAMAGATPPPMAETRAAIRAGLHFVVTGHVNGSYSLAVVNRLLALALEAARPGQVRLLPVEAGQAATPSDIPMSQRRALAAIAARPPTLSGPVAVISQHYPLHVPESQGDAAVAMLFWEESLLPADTVRTLNSRFAGVLAPAASVARALADSGVRVPIRLVGFAPELQRFAAVGAARCRRGGGRTNFLHVSSCFPRKGVDVLLAAWARAFGASDEVRLVIKGFPNSHNDVAAQIDAARAAHPDMAEIVFHNRDLSADALVALYAEADVMVLPSRGEGFNIPAAEALATGLRLIVTGFGGHMDFCAMPSLSDRIRLLDYRLIPSASHVAGAHSLWAEPDADDLVLALREAARGEPVRDRRAGADSLALAGLDTDSWAARVVDATTDLLLTPHNPPPRIAWVSPWQVRCGIAEYSRHLLSAFVPDPEARETPLILCDERPSRADRALPAPLRARPAFRIGDCSSVPQLAREVAVADPEVLMIQHQPGLLPWEALADLLETPAVQRRCVVVALHNTRDLLRIEPPLRARMATALAGVQRVLVHTVADLAVLQDLGVNNTAWLPHGTTRGPAPRTPRPMPRDAAPVIGTTGFFLPHKGTSRLLQAAALLRRDWPDLRLRLVCARYPEPVSDQEIAQCRALASQLDLLDAVEWETEFLPNERALHLLSGCDVVVMPYEPTLESASGAVRQALASGAPTLVSDLPVFDDLGDAVERLELTTPEAIAAHIAGLLKNPRRRAELQDHAQSWLAAHDWTSIGPRLQAMLDAYHGEYRASRQ